MWLVAPEGASEVCVVALDELPATGGGAPSWAVGAGVLLVLLGAVALLFTARGRRSAGTSHGPTPRLGAGAGAAVILVAALIGTFAGTFAASPAAQAIEIYEDPGCRLIAVTDIESFDGEALVPGDSVPLLTVTVTNRFAGTVSVLPEITVLGDSAVPSEPTEASAIAFAISGASEPFTLAPGESTQLTVTAALPLHADDTAQHTRSDVTLHLTTTERPNPEAEAR